MVFFTTLIIINAHKEEKEEGVLNFILKFQIIWGFLSERP
ncbi:MAG: hypothetical protein BAJALOKI1v1_530013 [Promethearchaeota archaeon]|nr:MAG: hypothetical protein BAJALOKI1v1_530013 [Candidatus Lokiarchaeota archaeon]